MGSNDCFVAMRCFWELSFVPGWICVAFCFHSVFFYYTDSSPECSYSRAWLALCPIQQSDQCMQISAHTVSCSLQRSQAKDPAAGLVPQLWAPASMHQAGTQCLQGNAVETSLSSLGLADFVYSVIPHPFFFPYLIFYIKSWRFLSASVWPPNPINIRIFFPHLQNKQTIRRPASPQLFLTF